MDGAKKIQSKINHRAGGDTHSSKTLCGSQTGNAPVRCGVSKKRLHRQLYLLRPSSVIGTGAVRDECFRWALECLFPSRLGSSIYATFDGQRHHSLFCHKCGKYCTIKQTSISKGHWLVRMKVKASCGGPMGAEDLERAIQEFTNPREKYSRLRKFNDNNDSVLVYLHIHYPHTWLSKDIDRLFQAFQGKSYLGEELTVEFLAHSCNTASFHKMIAGLASPKVPAKIKKIVVAGGLMPSKGWGPTRALYDPEMCQNALVPLIKSTTPWKCLCMVDILFDRASFQHVASALVSQSANVEFRGCTFDIVATEMFIKLYTSSETPLQALSLTLSPRLLVGDSNTFHSMSGEEMPLALVVESILGPGSRVGKFAFRFNYPLKCECGCVKGDTNREEFVRISKALVRTPSLRSLALLGHPNHEQCAVVADMIPKFQKLTEFGLDKLGSSHDERNLILEACRANSSIELFNLSEGESGTDFSEKHSLRRSAQSKP